MSASSKPPRHHSAKEPTTERVARALLDAEVFGDVVAGRKHGVHRNTILNWRRQWGETGAVIAEMNRLRAAVRDGWINEARDARRALIDRVTQLAAKSTNLSHVTNALRRVNEIVVADDILRDDAESDGADQPEAAGAREGSRGAEGPGEAPEG